MTGSRYHRNARRFFDEYEAIPFEQAHECFLGHLRNEPGVVLDVGAGSGRDASWFASRGNEVFAIEPADALRDMAANRHVDARIHWVDDRLPGLDRIRRSETRFDTVWLSAVWMHVAPDERPRAFRKLANCLRPGGRLYISLRHGPFEDDRTAYEVTAPELLELARRHGLICISHQGHNRDGRGREGVTWECMVFELPDDGSGGFARLRNIILNDDRSSTYKLGLLRAVLRVADGSAGHVEVTEHGDAVVPLGLVALYWLRLYKPLISSGFRQAPSRSGYGFAGPAFKELDVPPSALKPGASFQGPGAAQLQRALRDAALHIVNMPANFITDTRGRQIFEAAYRRQGLMGAMRLDAPTLSLFGEIVIPGDLWRTMCQHAVWIEPVIEEEWIRAMRRYDERLGQRHSHDAYKGALAWLSPERDTREVRAIVDELRTSTGRARCTWRGTLLRASYAVDHVMPWIRWPCNDLWNLVPTSVAANSSKGDRLPSAELLSSAEERFEEWWTLLRTGSDDRAERFELEVRATLPFVTHPSNARDLFDGVTLLRASLRRDQQIPEWNG